MPNNVNENTEGITTRPRLITAGVAAPLNKAKDPAAALPAAVENEELWWMLQHEKAELQLAGQSPGPGKAGCRTITAGSCAKRIQRKTFLRGQAIDPPRHSKQSVRRRTERDLIAAESEIPYTQWEKATRSLVCAIIERQDRLSEQFLLKVNDLEYRVDDLERDLDEIMQKTGRDP